MSTELFAGASAEAIRFHYDVGTDFFSLWLDENLVYSAGRWGVPFGNRAVAVTLMDAQSRKIDFHLEAVQAARCCRLLDIGCGWGAALRRAVADFGIREAVGLTLSRDQKAHIDGKAWPGVSVRLQSYETYTADALFDGIISVGAFEHFAKPGYEPGPKLAVYRGFFARCHEWLRRDGRLSLQTICWGAVDRRRSASLLPLDVFPESDLPYPDEVLSAANAWFEVEYVENGREDYIKTLGQWLVQLRASEESIVERFGGENTFRYYERYLRRAIAGFERKRMTLLRFVFTRR